MSDSKSSLTPTVYVKEVSASGDQRCEARWPLGAVAVDPPVKDWRGVRDIDLKIDSTTGEAVLSFTLPRHTNVGSSG
jgi:hypothetical protein